MEWRLLRKYHAEITGATSPARSQHPPPCANPRPASNNDFVVINNFGIHSVGLNYCGCQTTQEKRTQLIHASWFPATNINPKSAATFCPLHTFHLLSFQSRCSGFEFYSSLAWMTNNTRTQGIPVSYLITTRLIISFH